MAVSSVRYLFSIGTLSRKENALYFQNEKKHVHIPVEGIKEIYALNEISINTKLLDFLASKHIVLHCFNYYGHYSGSFYPKEKYTSGKLLIKQVEAFQSEKRNYIAKKIVKAISVNCLEVLYHYYKHGCKEVKPTIDWLRHGYEEPLASACSIAQIMSVEAEIWQRFFSCLKFILLQDFMFNKRVRQPPDNPINALISFGNTLLYTKCISILYQTHLDQTISFLHEPMEQRFSLSLDISEAFKPVIVFRTIFDLVNNGKLKVTKHFERKFNYCLLNEEGRQIFVKAFEERLEKTFVHPKLKRSISYATTIKLDCYKLIKYIFEDKEFEFYSLKTKM